MTLAPENLPTLVLFISVNNTHIIFSAIKKLLTILLRIQKRSTKELSRWKGKKRPEKRVKLLRHLADTEPLKVAEEVEGKQGEPKETRLGSHTRYSPKSELHANLEDNIGGGELTEMDPIRRLKLTNRTIFTLNVTASIRNILIFTSTN